MYRLILLAILIAATAVWAQDPSSDDAAVEETVAESPDDAATEEPDDFELDSQSDHTDEDDDVFKPTDAVSYQQSVPFPVDI
jgi:hypothetical protein